MYSKIARKTAALVIRSSTRSYATRRVIRETPAKPPTTTARSYQSVGQLLGQPGLAEASSQTPEGLSHGLHKGGIQPSDWPNPLSYESPEPEQTSLTQNGMEQITETLEDQTPVTSLYHRSTKYDREPHWQKIGRWKDVTEKEWLSHSWHIAKNIQGPQKLYKFLGEVIPETIPASKCSQHIHTRDDFIQDVVLGIKGAPMSIRLTPHILSLIDWNNPLDDPLRIQFIPMKSTFVPDHPKLTLDSLHEADDSPVQGLVHRYPDKVLFLGSFSSLKFSMASTYNVKKQPQSAASTAASALAPTPSAATPKTVTKAPNKPIKARWDDALAYISANPSISDVVVSGGDSYYLLPAQLRYIGDALLSIPHIRRFRIASKGLCVSPSRTLDMDDTWTDELVRLSNRGRERGKQVALHTHFNHVNEMSWVTREAAQKLFESGVVVRNQSVLLRGVNDDVESMGALVRELADLNIQPYYVYQCDLVRGIEDLRTPLSTILHLEQQLRGSIAGFMMPSFVVDLPGGGGKRLAASYECYDRGTGRSTFCGAGGEGEVGKEGKEGKVYEYWDPVRFVAEGEEGMMGGESAVGA